LKSALQKSPIPENHAFLVRHLKERYFDPNWHFHAEYQIFMVLNGEGTRFIGDHVAPFKPGNITFTGPDLPHLWRSDHETQQGIVEEPCEGIVLYFNENLIGKSFLQTEEAIRMRQLFKRSLRGLDVTGRTRETVHNMILELPDLNGFDGVLELLKILNILSNTNDLEPLASPGYTNSLKEGDTERMNKVYAYVMQNFRRKITVSELAELTSMTSTSFSRYFKVHANKTFSEFVSEIRIGHACKLLIERKVNASQACYASGFQTLSNFNKQFKTITKRTPLAYKKEYRAV